MLTFKYTILYVSDVAKTISFYETAFGCKSKFVTPDGDYGELLSDNVTLAFADHKLASSHFSNDYIKSDIKANPLGFELGFTTTNLESSLTQAVDAGATKISDIETKPWGQKVAYVRDCNGFLIELCTPIE